MGTIYYSDRSSIPVSTLRSFSWNCWFYPIIEKRDRSFRLVESEFYCHPILGLDFFVSLSMIVKFFLLVANVHSFSIHVFRNFMESYLLFLYSF